MKISILGSEWEIVEMSIKDEERLKDCDGFCDWTAKKMVIENEADGNLEVMNEYVKKVKRHEIVHAYLFESGLYENTNECNSWATNEEMVDWIARQGIKIYKSWQEADAI